MYDEDCFSTSCMQTSATITILDLMRTFEEARQKDRDIMMKVLENIPKELTANPPKNPIAVANFLQEEAFKEDLGSGKRELFVETLNIVQEETGVKLPPMRIKDGVSIKSVRSSRHFL